MVLQSIVQNESFTLNYPSARHIGCVMRKIECNIDVREEVISMTSNQVAYQNMLEQRRSNVARETETSYHNRNVEGETGRHNLITEGVMQGTLLETSRHNYATENYYASELLERHRHNYATELLTGRDISERKRHNIASERNDQGRLMLGYSQLGEQRRHSLVSESQMGYELSERTRSNKERERSIRVQTRNEKKARIAEQQERRRSNLEREKTEKFKAVVSPITNILGGLIKVAAFA